MLRSWSDRPADFSQLAGAFADPDSVPLRRHLGFRVVLGLQYQRRDETGCTHGRGGAPSGVEYDVDGVELMCALLPAAPVTCRPLEAKSFCGKVVDWNQAGDVHCVEYDDDSSEWHKLRFALPLALRLDSVPPLQSATKSHFD